MRVARFLGPADPTSVRRLLLALGVVGLLLAGCGGGSPGNVDTPAAPSDTPAPPPDVATDASPDVKPFDPADWDHGELLGWSPAAVPLDDEAFPLGVQAGGMEPEQVMLWTKLAAEGAATLRVFRDGPSDDEIVLVHEGEHTSDANGTLHVVVDGLAPGTWYSYTFLLPAADGKDYARRSAIGRVRTAFGPGDRSPLTISATHGTNWRQTPWVTLERAAEHDIDLFLHLGDIGYLDEASTGPEYRELWAKLLGDPGYRAILAHVGWLPIWDDHEVVNNYNPEDIDPERFRTARELFYEHTPVPQFPDTPLRLWRSYRWGDTAELFVLDCRSERRPSTAGTDDAIYLSREQMDWLKEGLLTSDATFKLILNSVPITLLPIEWWANVHEDSWPNYGSQREEILSFIDDQELRDVYWLTGDIHAGTVTRIEGTGPRARRYEITCGPGGNRSNPLPEFVEAGYFPREDVFPEELFLFWSGRLAVTLLTFDPNTDPPSVDIRFIDGVTGEENAHVVLPER